MNIKMAKLHDYKEYAVNFLTLILYHIEISFLSSQYNITVTLSVYFVHSPTENTSVIKKNLSPNIFHTCWKQRISLFFLLYVLKM